MNHAISNAGSLEAQHYRNLDRSERLALAAERGQIFAEARMKRFDAKDAIDALVCGTSGLIGSDYCRLTAQLAESMAAIVSGASTPERVDLLIHDIRKLAEHHVKEAA